MTAPGRRTIVPVFSHRRHAAAGIASAAAVCLVAGACGGGTPSSTTVSSACATTYKTWASGPHGTAAFQQVSTDAGIVSADLRQVASSNYAASAVTRTFSAGSKLGVDSSQALQNLPPPCVAGFARLYHVALTDTRQGSIDIMAAMTALRLGNQSAANNSVGAFASDLGSAQRNIHAAEAAISKETKS
jgi:hypothetical protein